MFRATGLTKVGLNAQEQQLDEEAAAEAAGITVHEVPLADITTFLADQERRGAFVDLKIYAGLYFAGKAF